VAGRGRSRDSLLSGGPDLGLGPGTPGSWPEVEADSQPAEPSRCSTPGPLFKG